MPFVYHVSYHHPGGVGNAAENSGGVPRRTLIVALPTWGRTEEEPIMTIRELLRNPQVYFFREVILRGDVIQVLSKETVEGTLIWSILLTDWSTTGVARIIGATTKGGKTPVQGDKIRISCTVVSNEISTTVSGATNEAIVCLYVEKEHGPIVFLN